VLIYLPIDIINIKLLDMNFEIKMKQKNLMQICFPFATPRLAENYLSSLVMLVSVDLILSRFALGKAGWFVFFFS
jgi:hypothetical protein